MNNKIITLTPEQLIARSRVQGKFVGRRFTQDAAFAYRMGAGSPGEVTRTHPASIYPGQNDATSPATTFGQALLINRGVANTWRSILTSDNAITDIDGVLVRPYPVQQGSGSNYGAQAFGTGGPVIPGQPLDILKSGSILVLVNGTPTLGGTVYIWVAAATGNHIVGGFEAANTGGSTIAIASDKTYFNGPPDANGVAELVFNV
jgi:hypothetical protein